MYRESPSLCAQREYCNALRTRQYESLLFTLHYATVVERLSAIDFILFLEFPLHFINCKAQFIRTCYTRYMLYLLFCSYLCNLPYSNKTRLCCVCILYRCVVVVFGKSIGRLKALDFTLYHSFMFCYNFGISASSCFSVYLFSTLQLMSNPCLVGFSEFSEPALTVPIDHAFRNCVFL